MRETLCHCAGCGETIETLYGELLECRGCGLCSDCCECRDPEWEQRMLRAQGRLGRRGVAAGQRDQEEAE
jgi:hypothetical protein